MSYNITLAMLGTEIFKPQDFFHGAPPRVMGIEAEDLIRLRHYSSYAPEADFLRRDEECAAGESLLSLGNFKRAGIEANLQRTQDLWLANGARFYIDRSQNKKRKDNMLEYCTPENRGPKKTLASALGGIDVIGKVADASEIPLIIFRRNGTYDPINKEFNNMGFHMNHLISIEYVKGYLESKNLFQMSEKVLSTHAATRMYTWEGMVGPNGFLLSQKASKNAKLFFRFKNNDSDASSGFARLEDYMGEHSSQWGVFMALATTSILLRIFEHPDQTDLQKRLIELTLENPSSAIAEVSNDLSFKHTLTLANGKKRSALQIQTEYAKIAAEFASQCTLPEDEQFAVSQWNYICEDLARSAQTGDLRPLMNRMGNIRKYLWLKRKNIGDITYDNHEAVRSDMDWDMIYPRVGGRLQNPRGKAVTIVSADEIQSTVEDPPTDTRAWIRGNFIKGSQFAVNILDWGYLDGSRKKNEKWEMINGDLHPYVGKGSLNKFGVT